MKVFLLTCLISLCAHSQVFNTAQSLKSGQFVFRANGVSSQNAFVLNLHGGYGISSGMDLEAQLGFGKNANYFGIDLELVMFAKRDNAFSLSFGFHNASNYGLDATANFSTEIANKFYLYGAFDLDLEFIKVANNTSSEFFPYIVIGADIPTSRNFSLGFEGDLAIGENGENKIVFGINYYF